MSVPTNNLPFYYASMQAHVPQLALPGTQPFAMPSYQDQNYALSSFPTVSGASSFKIPNYSHPSNDHYHSAMPPSTYIPTTFNASGILPIDTATKQGLQPVSGPSRPRHTLYLNTSYTAFHPYQRVQQVDLSPSKQATRLIQPKSQTVPELSSQGPSQVPGPRKKTGSSVLKKTGMTQFLATSGATKKQVTFASNRDVDAAHLGAFKIPAVPAFPTQTAYPTPSSMGPPLPTHQNAVLDLTSPILVPSTAFPTSLATGNSIPMITSEFVTLGDTTYQPATSYPYQRQPMAMVDPLQSMPRISVPASTMSLGIDDFTMSPSVSPQVDTIVLPPPSYEEAQQAQDPTLVTDVTEKGGDFLEACLMLGWELDGRLE